MLISAILSQNTSDQNSSQAFRALREKFASWDEVLNTPESELSRILKPAGLYRQKAHRIKVILRELNLRFGHPTLAPLRRMGAKEARDLLLSFTGVGQKTAACVLLFGLGRPSFPVDTHIERVSKRLGLIPKEARPEEVAQFFEARTPRDKFYQLHLHLIRHGREVCQARRPRCERCGLSSLCSPWDRF